MTSHLVTIPSNATAEDAAKKMIIGKSGALFVEENKQIKGILTQGDIVSKIVAAEKDPKKILVKDIYNASIIMIDENEDIFKAADLLAHYDIRRLAVVRGGKIVGLISTKIIGARIRTLTERMHSV